MADIVSTVEEALKIMRSLRPGERYLYFVGYLERERYFNKTSVSSQVATAAYDLMQAGRVHLVQKRSGPPITKDGRVDWREGCCEAFEYYAVGALPRTRKPRFFVVEGSSKVMA